MRLIDLTIRNFRGFGNDGKSIRLDRDLILIYGPNGHGKTSIAEAIEWLFYGSTKRRLHGEGYSKAEYAGTYANVHNGRPVQVDAAVSFGGSTHVLSRRLSERGRGEFTETLIDGQLSSFSALGFESVESVYPVVAQHGLQTFIHSKPKDRRDAIGAALGLDALTTFKSALDSARSSFQRSPPTAVVQARKELLANCAALAKIPEAKELAANWQKIPMLIQPSEDRTALLAASSALCGARFRDAEGALTALRVQRGILSKALFDVSSIAPSAAVTEYIQDFMEKADLVNSAIEDFQKALSDAIASLAATYSTALLDFWSKGLELSQGDDSCPLCEQTTLTVMKRGELQQRITEGATHIANDKVFKSKIQFLQAGLASLKMAVES